MTQRTLKQHQGLNFGENIYQPQVTPIDELQSRDSRAVAFIVVEHMSLLKTPKIATSHRSFCLYPQKPAEITFLFSIYHYNLSSSLSCIIPQDGYYKYLHIPHLNASSSSQVARPSPVVPQSPSLFSSRCLLVVARSGRTQSPPWTPRNLRRSANRPTVEGWFLPLPLISHQTNLKVKCPSCQRTMTTLTTA